MRSVTATLRAVFGIEAGTNSGTGSGSERKGRSTPSSTHSGLDPQKALHRPLESLLAKLHQRLLALCDMPFPIAYTYLVEGRCVRGRVVGSFPIGAVRTGCDPQEEHAEEVHVIFGIADEASAGQQDARSGRRARE